MNGVQAGCGASVRVALDIAIKEVGHVAVAFLGLGHARDSSNAIGLKSKLRDAVGKYDVNGHVRYKVR